MNIVLHYSRYSTSSAESSKALIPGCYEYISLWEIDIYKDKFCMCAVVYKGQLYIFDRTYKKGTIVKLTNTALLH